MQADKKQGGFYIRCIKRLDSKNNNSIYSYRFSQIFIINTGSPVITVAKR